MIDETPSTDPQQDLDDIDTVADASDQIDALREETEDSPENESKLVELIKKILEIFGIKKFDETDKDSTGTPRERAARHLPNEITSDTISATPDGPMAEILTEFNDRAIIFTGRFEGNGGRECALIIPRNLDLTQAINLIYHFHGLNSHDPSATDRLGRTTESLLASNQNSILFYPLNSPPTSSNYNYNWMDGEGDNGNFDTLHNEVTGLLASNGINLGTGSQTIIEGHSAGGSPMRRIAKKQPAYSTRIDKMVCQDCAYGNWMEEAVEARPDIQFELLCKPGTETWREELASNSNVNLYNMNSTGDLDRKSHGEICEYVGGMPPGAEAESRLVT